MKRVYGSVRVLGAIVGLGVFGCSPTDGEPFQFSTGGSLGATGGGSQGGTGSDATPTGGASPTGAVIAASGGQVESGGADAATGGSAPATGATLATGGTGSGGQSMPGSGGTLAGAANACGLPDVMDYGAPGPYGDADVFAGVGPSGNYTLFRPTASLGRDGVKHPVAVWGNGIATTPDQYTHLLLHIASHGFVVIACNDTTAERPCLNDGMAWLVAQNDSGEMQGKLDVERELTIGYSWGGGAAIDTANRPHVKATISIHGMPPRETNAFADMHAPLLLFTSTGDTFVNATEYVTPNYDASTVPTFYATLDEPVGHLYPLDDGTVGCVGGPLFVGQNQGPCESAAKEQAPIVVWMRLWACDDESTKRYFYGPDCLLCRPPWNSVSKPAGAFQ